jgi:hypothetical protein
MCPRGFVTCVGTIQKDLHSYPSKYLCIGPLSILVERSNLTSAFPDNQGNRFRDIPSHSLQIPKAPSLPKQLQNTYKTPHTDTKTHATTPCQTVGPIHPNQIRCRHHIRDAHGKDFRPIFIPIFISIFNRK